MRHIAGLEKVGRRPGGEREDTQHAEVKVKLVLKCTSENISV